MKKVVVVNLYGKHNIGDMAIRSSALNILEETFGVNNFSLLCESKENFYTYSNVKSKLNIDWAPYGYAIRAKGKPQNLLIKYIRFVTILSNSIFFTLLGIINVNLLPKNGFYKYIRLIIESDIVVAMGGGYFITSNPLKDFFGICLNVLPIYVAKIYKKKILILPSSFGPFAHKVHELIVGTAIKNTIFMTREEISHKLVSKYCADVEYIPDLALMDWEISPVIKKENYFVLTFRESLKDKNRQGQFEKEIAVFIEYVWQKYGYECIFIPMASNPIEENDVKVAINIAKYLPKNAHFKIVKVMNPNEAKLILSKAKFSLCNRLHSAILSSIVFTPFITISYAYKTIGFLKMFDLGEWNIPMKEINSKELITKLELLMDNDNYSTFIKKLNAKREYVFESRQKIKEILKKHWKLINI